MKLKSFSFLTIFTALIAVALNSNANDADPQDQTETQRSAPSEKSRTYSYATRGVIELPKLKLLLDEGNLGGKELEMAEITFVAGSIDGEHQHGSVEIFYVLAGTFGHEVNGELHMLTPGMVGVVRPGDTVRHIVPKEADAKVLVIWAPAGEAQRLGITTPLRCPSAQVATYKGAGSLKEAKNFDCKT